MKALYIETAGEFLIVQVPGEKAQRCAKLDDAEEIRQILLDAYKQAPKNPAPTEEPAQPPAAQQPQPAGTDGATYDGTVLDAVGEVLGDPTIREAASSGVAAVMNFAEQVRLKRKPKEEAKESG